MTIASKHSKIARLFQEYILNKMKSENILNIKGKIGLVA
jgi:hypothetical protein